MKKKTITYDIMSAKEKEAAAKQTFTFLAPLTNEQSCEAGRKSAIARVREYERRGIIWNTKITDMSRNIRCIQRG